MTWRIPIMEPVPFHLLTAIFVGWLEPVPPGNRVVFIADHAAVEFLAFDAVGPLQLNPAMQKDLVDLSSELCMTRDCYDEGCVFEGYLEVGEGDLTDDRFVIRFVMPVGALSTHRDDDDLSTRRLHLAELMAAVKPKHVHLVNQVGIMSRAGVLDETKLDDVARDLGVSTLMLCNNWSRWQTSTPPHVSTGMYGPGWTLWHRPNTEDF